MRNSILLLFLSGSITLLSQTDSTLINEDEDYSIYENATFTEGTNKVFCSPKILDLCPARFLSLAWDQQLPYDMKLSQIGNYPADTKNVLPYETARVNRTGGLRLYANIPVISTNKILWQMGLNYWNIKYAFSEIDGPPAENSVIHQIQKNGLTTAGLHSTVYKPLNDRQFILVQASSDLSGNYTFSDVQDLRAMRYSAAVLWGRRSHDRKQWAIGVTRTYRVGEVNYIPVVLYNWTSPGRKWGTEILFPARMHLRKNFSTRSLLLGGYELEGQSYRIRGVPLAVDKALEIRRGELRFRLEYQRQLFGFIWGTIQAGYRYDYSFHADYTDRNGPDFFRGFFGQQQYAMINQLGGAVYFNVGIHLVSP